MDNENIAGGTVETPIDWEARALKAENKIVELKKSTKPTKEEVVKKEEAPAEEPKQEEEKAEDAPIETTKNEDEVEILKAKLAALEAEKQEDINVATTQMMGISGNATPSAPSEYKLSDLEKMNQTEYNKAKDLIDKGEATMIRD